MLNHVIISGFIRKMPEFKENSLIECQMQIEITRPYQESNGDFKSDIVDVLLWRGLAEEIKDNYCLNEIIILSGHLKQIEDKLFVKAENLNI